MRSKGVFGVLVVTTILIFIVSLNIRNVKEIQPPGTRISVHASNETIVPSLVRVQGAGDEIMRMVDVSENIVNDNDSKNVPPNWYCHKDVEVKLKTTARGGGNIVIDMFYRTCLVIVLLASPLIVWIVASDKVSLLGSTTWPGQSDMLVPGVSSSPMQVFSADVKDTVRDKIRLAEDSTAIPALQGFHTTAQQNESSSACVSFSSADENSNMRDMILLAERSATATISRGTSTSFSRITEANPFKVL